MSIDVELTDLAYGGDAVGRYEGRVLFVPGGIPGERVQVELSSNGGDMPVLLSWKFCALHPTALIPSIRYSRIAAASGNISRTPRN